MLLHNGYIDQFNNVRLVKSAQDVVDAKGSDEIARAGRFNNCEFLIR